MARFFKDRPDILIPIRWLPADPKAPRVPWSSSFLSLDWTSSQQASNEPNFQDEPWLQRPGEVFNEARPYNAATKLLGLKYDHVCGTADQFAFGATYDPTLNVQYDEQGLPLCCNGPAVPFFALVMGFEIEEPPPAELNLGEPCANAVGPIAPGDYLFVPQAGSLSIDQWWFFNAIAGHHYRITTFDIGETTQPATTVPTDCSETTILANQIGYGAATFVAPSSGPIPVVMNTLASAVFVYTWSVKFEDLGP